MTNKRPFFRLLAGAALVLGAANAAPANSPIGMAVTNGTLQVDHTRVSGSATIFEGSTVDTSAAASMIRLDSGARLRLSSETHVRVYPNRLVMESGLGEFESAKGYEVEARTLRISPTTADAVARIRVVGDRKVTVASVRGTVRVANFAGVVVANVEAGSSLDLEPQEAGAALPTHASGCLLVKSGKPIIVDRTTNVILELQGPILTSEIGNRVEITAVAAKVPPTLDDASQLVKVAAFKQIAKGGCSAIAKKIGASVSAGALAGGALAASTAGGGAAAGGAAAGAAAGIGATTVAVVGGVAAAATVGGLAAAGSPAGPGRRRS